MQIALSKLDTNLFFQCRPGLGTKVLYKLLYQEPTKMMVLSGCSIVSTFVAQAAKMWNLVVVSTQFIYYVVYTVFIRQ